MILMAGGLEDEDESSGVYTTRTVLFDTKTGSGREVASLKYPRHTASMEIYRGRAVILGGYDGSGRRSDGEVWNMDTETWEEADIHLNIARNSFSLVATDED